MDLVVRDSGGNETLLATFRPRRLGGLDSAPASPLKPGESRSFRLDRPAVSGELTLVLRYRRNADDLRAYQVEFLSRTLRF
jgi:hypothetical protein